MLYRAAIGPINTDAYLPVFTRFEASGRVGASWNWAASLYTLNWLVFRGLWGAALVYSAVLVFVPFLVLAMGRLVWQWSEPVELTVGLVGLALLFVLPGVLANAHFYRKTRMNLAVALAGTATLEQACGLLLGQSASRQRFIRILATNAALLFLVAPVAVLLLTRHSPAPMQMSVDASASIAVPTPTAAPVSSPLAVRASEVLSPSLPVLAAMPVTPVSAPPQRMASSPLPTAPLNVVSAVSPESAVPPVPPPKPAAGKAVLFYVNVGLFADAGNAQRAHQKLKGAGLPVVSQPVSGPKGKLTRVRAGPFSSRGNADQAVKQIKALALDAVLLPP